jgi:hypothetical protein
VCFDDVVDGSEEEEIEKDFTTTAEKNTEFSDGDADADVDGDIILDDTIYDDSNIIKNVQHALDDLEDIAANWL